MVFSSVFLQTSNKRSTLIERLCTIDYFQVIKKIQVSKYTCQLIFDLIFIFVLFEGHEILHLFAKDLKIKAKRESGKFSVVIGFFGDWQHKRQCLFVFAEH